MTARRLLLGSNQSPFLIGALVIVCAAALAIHSYKLGMRKADSDQLSKWNVYNKDMAGSPSTGVSFKYPATWETSSGVGTYSTETYNDQSFVITVRPFTSLTAVVIVERFASLAAVANSLRANTNSATLQGLLDSALAKPNDRPFSSYVSGTLNGRKAYVASQDGNSSVKQYYVQDGASYCVVSLLGGQEQKSETDIGRQIVSSITLP